jgi:putative nucleotidyltransferase with HDIG domain
MVTLAIDLSSLPAELCDRLEARLGGDALDLPVLPEAAAEVVRATMNEDTDVRKLVEILRRDQTLASHVLRVANSPVYGGRGRILSLQQGVSRLGTTLLRQIALSISCQARIFRVKGHEGRVREMFRHSVATSFVAQEIARRQRRNVEEAFLSGLLHDVGRPLVLQEVVELGKTLHCDLPQFALEQVTDAFHARMGAKVARAWGFAPSLIASIEHHHDPVKADAYQNLAALVALSDDVAHHVLASRPVEIATLEGHPSLPVIHLYVDDLHELLGRSAEILAWTEAFA